MAKRGKLLPTLLLALAIVAVRLSTTFVPPPPTLQWHASLVAPAAAAAGFAGMMPAALASPLEDAALKLADASYPRVAKLLGSDKGQLADVVSKVLSSTNYDVSVAATVDKAVEALLATDAIKLKGSLDVIDKGLDLAVAKGGLVPPIEAVQDAARAVAAAVESGGGSKFKAFIDAVVEQGSVVKVLEGLKFDDASKKAFAEFLTVAASTEGQAAAAPSGAVQASAAITDAAVKFADASYPIVEKLDDIGGKTIGPLAGKAIGIAFSGDAAKVGKAADAALETLASANQANVYEVLAALDTALDAAVANGGLLPPLAQVEGVAKAIAGALATIGEGKLSAILPLVLDAANSADKFQILGILGDGSGLVSKINPADVAAATSAALALAKAAGAQ